MYSGGVGRIGHTSKGCVANVLSCQGLRQSGSVANWYTHGQNRTP